MGYQTVRTNNTDGQIYQEMQITASATPSAAVQVPFQKVDPNGVGSTTQHVFCTARGDNIIFKFGADSTTAASASVSSSLLAAFNFSVEEGATKATDLNGLTQTWVSVVSEDTIGGTAIIELINTNI